MKKILLMAIITLAAMQQSAFASKASRETSTQKSAYYVAFNKIELNDGIHLILKHEATNSINFTGTDKDITNVKWEINNGTLSIGARKGKMQQTVTIELSVRDLEEIIVNGDAKVTSVNDLKSEVLKVKLEGNGTVAIKNSGKILLNSDEDIQLDVRKKVGDVIILKDKK